MALPGGSLTIRSHSVRRCSLLWRRSICSIGYGSAQIHIVRRELHRDETIVLANRTPEQIKRLRVPDSGMKGQVLEGILLWRYFPECVFHLEYYHCVISVPLEYNECTTDVRGMYQGCTTDASMMYVSSKREV